MIEFDCPSCHSKLLAAEEHAGKTIECPTCKMTAQVPADQNAGAITATPSAEPPSPPPTSVTTPEHAKSARSKRSRDDDDVEDAPRRPREESAGTGGKVAAGMGIGIFLAVGFLSCCLIVPILVALLVPPCKKARPLHAPSR